MKKYNVVLTGGCFDLVHRGHLEYLQEAKSLGQKLIVALNSDSSVKRYKGDLRPINNQEDRKFFLESLKFVDEVVIFDEDHPGEVIKKIKPDVFVKGGDYDMTKIPEYEIVKSYNGDLINLKFVEGYSSTKIIERIKSLS